MPNGSPKIPVKQALEHLDTILKSPFFAPSKRCQEFLRYIVLETSEGRGDLIKERNIASAVFGKGIDFEPGDDSVVRVKAREVRKRLLDYYESTPDSDLRIEIPLGGYVPVIHRAHEPINPNPSHPEVAKAGVKPFGRRKFAWLLGGSIGALGAATITYPLLHEHTAPLDLLWRPVFATKSQLLIFVPILKNQGGELTDRVGIGPAATLRRAADFLTEHGYPYHLRFGAELTFSQLTEQPSLLLGGFSSVWTLQMTRDLRFELVNGDEKLGPVVIDKRTNQTWKPVNLSPSHLYADQDYGIACRLFDPASGQVVLIAAGITTFGTEGAADIFFDPKLFSALLKQAPSNWETKNFQAVIRVSIVGTTPSSHQVVASYFW